MGYTWLQMLSLISKMSNVYEEEDLAFFKMYITDDTMVKIPDFILESITSICEYAFYNCTNLALTSLPEGITSIGNSAFCKCISLVTLTFEGTPNTISSYAFSDCNNLTTINVPWAEGAVSNAPWGATNATINYNYVEG